MRSEPYNGIQNQKATNATVIAAPSVDSPSMVSFVSSSILQSNSAREREAKVIHKEPSNSSAGQPHDYERKRDEDGSGGGFTENGALTAAATSPSD
jgi:hypothetical protein